MTEVTPFYNYEAIVPKLRDVIEAGPGGAGLGAPVAGQLCIEAAVCLVLGLPHSDSPKGCVGDPDRRFAIRLNDANWSSDKARAEGMAEFAIAHLGSATMTAKQRKVWRRHSWSRPSGASCPWRCARSVRPRRCWRRPTVARA